MPSDLGQVSTTKLWTAFSTLVLLPVMTVSGEQAASRDATAKMMTKALRVICDFMLYIPFLYDLFVYQCTYDTIIHIHD
jgi:hypothetical protein